MPQSNSFTGAIRDLSTLQVLSATDSPHLQPSPSPSADPALCSLTTALAAALVLHTLRTPLPIFWTPTYVEVAANAVLEPYSPPSALGCANGAAAPAPAPERRAASFSHHPASAASYILHITGGNDEQGFPMKQGVLLWHQAAALGQPLVTVTCATAPAAPASASPRPKGELPKRVNKNLTKEDIGEYIVRRAITGKEGARPCTKAPKIQRSVTPIRLQHSHHLKSLIRRRSEHQKEQKADFDSDAKPYDPCFPLKQSFSYWRYVRSSSGVNQALGNVFLSPTMWTDEIFIGALSDALVQRTRPALYDQLDVDLADNLDSEDESKDSTQGDAPSSSYAELRAMCTQVMAETALVCEQRNTLVAENNSLKAENSKMKIQKALYERARDKKRTKEGEESSPDRKPVQDFEAYIFPVLTQLVADDAQPILCHAGTLCTDDGPCKTCTRDSESVV
ncbi:hypothetical protein DFH08DRAFT_931124 [Mycena albidolilacea]|uniref:Uncharacterized protein n=1 Tax=Mycena albidolilacea TaxID=1033008 RepID=A0AAD7AJC6_9AGAR|nr:hypothetical protein DFH08DRAFT_931124 [Mycena albidolilacea]